MEKWLFYKGTCHVILLAKLHELAKLHDMYLYKTHNLFHINHYLKSVLKVALLHRFYCIQSTNSNITPDKALFFQAKGLLCVLYLHKNLCCGYLLDASLEYPHLSFSWRNQKNIYLIPPNLKLCSYQVNGLEFEPGEECPILEP